MSATLTPERPSLRPPDNADEARLARVISYFIARRRDAGDTIDEVMLRIDAKWPSVTFKVACAAFALEQYRRARAPDAGRMLQ